MCSLKNIFFALPEVTRWQVAAIGAGEREKIWFLSTDDLAVITSYTRSIGNIATNSLTVVSGHTGAITTGHLTIITS